LLPKPLDTSVTPLEEDESDAWPDEPKEFDPDSLGPDIPDSSPTLGESIGASADVPEELFRAFWAAVLFFNVALAALSIGAMLIYFRGDYGTGVPVLLVGVVAGLATLRYYWGVKAGRYSGSKNADSDRTGDSADQGAK
jgi:hypothetical protein